MKTLQSLLALNETQGVPSFEDIFNVVSDEFENNGSDEISLKGLWPREGQSFSLDVETRTHELDISFKVTVNGKVATIECTSHSTKIEPMTVQLGSTPKDAAYDILSAIEDASLEAEDRMEQEYGQDEEEED